MTVGRNLHMSARTGFQVEGMTGTGTSKDELFFIDCPDICQASACCTQVLSHQHCAFVMDTKEAFATGQVILHSSNCLVTS